MFLCYCKISSCPNICKNLLFGSSLPVIDRTINHKKGGKNKSLLIANNMINYMHSALYIANNMVNYIQSALYIANNMVNYMHSVLYIANNMVNYIHLALYVANNMVNLSQQ